MKKNTFLKVIAVAIVSVLMLLTLASCAGGAGRSSAADANGDHGSLHWDYKKDGQTLTVTGAGEMQNFDSPSSVAWAAVVASVKKVVIAEGVTSIADYAFYNMTSLEEVSVPSSVEVIGKMAFAFTPALVGVELHEGVMNIGYGAFEASGIKTMELPKSVTDISDRAFIYCDDLTHVVAHGVTSIGNEAFAYCKALESIKLPDAFIKAPTYGSDVFKDAKINENNAVAADVTYTLTITYVDESGAEVAPSVIKLLSDGEAYDVASPQIDKKTPDKDKISGTVADADITEKVTYKEAVVETEAPAETAPVTPTPEDDKLEPMTVVALVVTVVIIIGIVVATVIFIRREKNGGAKGSKKGSNGKKNKK